MLMREAAGILSPLHRHLRRIVWAARNRIRGRVTATWAPPICNRSPVEEEKPRSCRVRCGGGRYGNGATGKSMPSGGAECVEPGSQHSVCLRPVKGSRRCKNSPDT
ncbi:hypothetical protein MRX96_058175 [Rhipicephalus microplus]